MVTKLLSLDDNERQSQQRVLDIRCLNLPGLSAASTVLAYVSSFPEEVNTRPILEFILAGGRRLVCPRVDRVERMLTLYEIKDLWKDLGKGVLGILEPTDACARISPEEIDFVLVPALAFDQRGYRLGRGGGYYDRLLPSLRADCSRWVVGFNEQWVQTLPVEQHDQKVDGVLTPDRTERFCR